MCVCVHMYVRVCVCARAPSQVCVCTHVYVLCGCVYICVYAHVCMIFVCAQVCVYARPEPIMLLELPIMLLSITHYAQNYASDS